jgi:hypothetical protein
MFQWFRDFYRTYFGTRSVKGTALNRFITPRQD